MIRPSGKSIMISPEDVSKRLIWGYKLAEDEEVKPSKPSKKKTPNKKKGDR